MKQIIDWLRTVEESAYELYSGSCEFFSHDRDLADFLRRLASDELWHFHLMGSASDFVARSEKPIIASIDLDIVTINRVERPLRDTHALLEQGTLSQKQIVEALIQAERSEWNKLFLYCINTLKAFSKLFERGASVIQSHQDRIQEFLGGHPDGAQYVSAIRQLPAIWKQRFLIVEDQEALRVLLSDVLESRGIVVETAQDGIEGLEKARRQFFNAILSDINMPRMTGLDFYKEACKEDPDIATHFVFYSGHVDAGHEQFFRENNLSYFKKPFTLHHFMEIVEKLLQRSRDAAERAEPLL
jgi:CheY-like chemotaxis protein